MEFHPPAPSKEGEHPRHGRRLELHLEGRTGLILGVANKRSIAWACAQAMQREGMRLCFTYMGERMERGVRELAADVPNSIVLPCDVTQPETIDKVVEVLKQEFGSLDCVVHGVAFAKREELQGDFFNTSREGYMLAHEISAYSLTAIVRRVLPLMEGRPGSIITLTYIGGERVVPNYNVMGIAKAALEASVRYLAHDLGPRGIRVNAISPGLTLTEGVHSAGIAGSDFEREMIAITPLGRAAQPVDIALPAVFLASDDARFITGETLYVGGGIGM